MALEIGIPNRNMAMRFGEALNKGAKVLEGLLLDYSGDYIPDLDEECVQGIAEFISTSPTLKTVDLEGMAETHGHNDALAALLHAVERNPKI